MTLAVRISSVGWRSSALTSAGTNTFPLVGSFWDYSDNDLIDNNKYVTLSKIDGNRQTKLIALPLAHARGVINILQLTLGLGINIQL